MKKEHIRAIALGGLGVGVGVGVGYGIASLVNKETPPPLQRTLTPIPTATETPERSNDWSNIWPKTPEQAAKAFGGRADQWKVNPDWNGKEVRNRWNISYQTYEWRPANPEDLPFPWPKTPEEAVDYFFPFLTPQQKEALLEGGYIMPAWVNPETGLVEGWHLSEDHWLKTGLPDLSVILHPGEVAEGYTVNGTQDPNDDRSWLVFGGFRPDTNNEPVAIIQFISGQGMTICMPGTDPQKIGMEMCVPNNNYYDFGQLGPESYGFDPIYPTHNNK